MNNIKIIFVLLLSGIASTRVSKAADKTAGIWTEMAASKKVHSFVFGLTSEVLTRENSSTLERVGVGLKADYSLLKWMNAGVGYSLMDFKKTGYFELKDRFYMQLEPLWKFSNFICSLRERLQVTVTPSAKTNVPDSYYWRNRLEIFYKKNPWKVEPILDMETWYHFGEYRRSITEGYRISMGANIHPDAHQKVKVYGMLTDGTIISQYIFGVSYEFRL